MATKLFIVDASQPSEALIQQATDRLMQRELAQFADLIVTSRLMWRRFRELVEQPEFPEQWSAPFTEEFGHEPTDPSVLIDGLSAVDPARRNELRPRALEIARAWAKQEGASDEDDNFLRELGIAS